MVGPVEKNAQSIPCRVDLEVRFGNRGMPLRPPRGQDILLHENEEVTVHILPTVLEVRERRNIAEGAIRVTHKTRVHLGMDPFAEPQKRDHPVMHGRQMSQKVNNAVAYVEIGVRPGVTEK